MEEFPDYKPLFDCDMKNLQLRLSRPEQSCRSEHWSASWNVGSRCSRREPICWAARWPASWNADYVILLPVFTLIQGSLYLYCYKRKNS